MIFSGEVPRVEGSLEKRGGEHIREKERAGTLFLDS